MCFCQARGQVTQDLKLRCGSPAHLQHSCQVSFWNGVRSFPGLRPEWPQWAADQKAVTVANGAKLHSNPVVRDNEHNGNVSPITGKCIAGRSFPRLALERSCIRAQKLAALDALQHPCRLRARRRTSSRIRAQLDVRPRPADNTILQHRFPWVRSTVLPCMLSPFS